MLSNRRLFQFFGHQQYLRFGVRDRIIRRFHNPDQSAAEEFVVPFFGAKYRGNFDTYIDWNVFYYGAYRGEELQLMADFLAPMREPVVMDVGANVGHHTLFAATKAKKVLAFEPFEPVARKLNQKLRDNSLSNVQVFVFALGDSNITAPYSPPNGHNSGTGSFRWSPDSKKQLQLQIRRGDDVLEEESIAKIDFIKIDTEGFEVAVLKGLAETLRRDRPVVLFEWMQNPAKSGLFPDGYTYYRLIPQKPRWKLFQTSSYGLRLLGQHWPNANLLAVPNEYTANLTANHPGCAALLRMLASTNKRRLTKSSTVVSEQPRPVS